MKCLNCFLHKEKSILREDIRNKDRTETYSHYRCPVCKVYYLIIDIEKAQRDRNLVMLSNRPTLAHLYRNQKGKMFLYAEIDDPQNLHLLHPSFRC